LKTQDLGPRDGKLELRGDDSGAEITLVFLDRERIGLFDSWSDLIEALAPVAPPKIDPAGCQFLLAYGLVPPPYTVYANVYQLGVGDRLIVDPDGGEARFTVDYPYFDESSRGDGRYDAGCLRKLLGDAVARAVPADEPALLMQSAGKDSAGLLLGIAEAGLDNVRAVTYDAAYLEQEASPAKELARHFGVPHSVVATDPAAEIDAFLRFAERSPAVCADVTLFPYLLALEQSGVERGVVVDGLGNDGYMGYVEPRRDATLRVVASARRFPRLWGRFEPPDAGARLAYVWKTMQMYPAERCLAGSRLAPSTVRRLIPSETLFLRHFAAVDRKWRHRSPVDFRSFVRGRIFDGAMTIPKGRLAAASVGARAVYPYCDAELIDFYFHLPRADRYDESTRTNKTALRRLLAEELGSSPYLDRKGSFRFDVVRFVAVNESRIRAEIERARPLLRDLDRWSGFLFGRKSNYVHAYELVTLFMFCAWLVRRPEAVLQPLRDGAAGEERPEVTVEV
jgi:asparagine synthetase B (glutamine-hydrolysing)